MAYILAKISKFTKQCTVYIVQYRWLPQAQCYHTLL